MANKLHVAFLRKGSNAWNVWKIMYSKVEPDFRNANLHSTDISGADLRSADLREANLSHATINYANLSDADLSGADLSGAILIKTNLTGAILTHCFVYGISAWNVQLNGAIQNNLIITEGSESKITVDNLNIAQFIYSLLNNEEIRHVINTLTTKVVLILGRFTPERKVILEALREELRKQDYLPILFDF